MPRAVSFNSPAPVAYMFFWRQKLLHVTLHGRRYILFPRLSWLLVIVFRESALKTAAWFSCVVLNQITMFEVVACFSWALSLCPLCMRTSPHSTHMFNHDSLIFNFLLFPSHLSERIKKWRHITEISVSSFRCMEKP